jgi:hypothetical protein
MDEFNNAQVTRCFLILGAQKMPATRVVLIFLHMFSKVRFLIFIHMKNFATHYKSWLSAKWLSACSNTGHVSVYNSYTCLNIESSAQMKQPPENSSMLVRTVGPVGVLDTIRAFCNYKRLKHTFHKGN